ncbi:MAG: ClbS/DfsB family four-helix bundle protein [Planctomycetaceae bacterium]|nr:ClbS/DfsB family four-helix bundle protein [Planctomycetaceae bacterium]
MGSYCVSATSSHYDWAMKKIKMHTKNKENILWIIQ